MGIAVGNADFVLALRNGDARSVIGERSGGIQDLGRPVFKEEFGVIDIEPGIDDRENLVIATVLFPDVIDVSEVLEIDLFGIKGFGSWV